MNSDNSVKDASCVVRVWSFGGQKMPRKWAGPISTTTVAFLQASLSPHLCMYCVCSFIVGLSARAQCRDSDSCKGMWRKSVLNRTETSPTAYSLPQGQVCSPLVPESAAEICSRVIWTHQGRHHPGRHEERDDSERDDSERDDSERDDSERDGLSEGSCH